MLSGMWSRGVCGALAGAFDDGLCRCVLEHSVAEEPGAVGQRVESLDLTAFGGKPQRLGADAEMRSRLGQVEPWFVAIRRGAWTGIL